MTYPFKVALAQIVVAWCGTWNVLGGRTALHTITATVATTWLVPP